MTKAKQAKKADPKKAQKKREVINWDVKGNEIVASTNWNKQGLSVRGNMFHEAIKAAKKGSKELSAVMRGEDVNALGQLEADSKARKAGKCVNTHYEAIKTLRKRILESVKS